MLSCARPAEAQSTLQLWGHFSFNGPIGTGSRSSWSTDLEPQVQVAAPAGTPGWGAFIVTPAMDVAVARWLDVVGETAGTYTHQSDELDSFELTPRAGLRFHVFSRALPAVAHGHLLPDLPSSRRVVIRDLLRLESRNIFYNGTKPNSHTARLRNRLELQVPLNRARTTDDGATVLMADWEWFRPVDDPTERFANRHRIRAGLAFRHNASWRVETLYVWTKSRNTIDEPFETSGHAISLAVKWYGRPESARK